MPESYQVVLSAEAERNIEEAYLWIARNDPEAAARWVRGLMEALRDLAVLPLRYPLSPESRLHFTDQPIRQLLYGSQFWKYRVLFAVEGDRVLIAHVCHGARLYLGEEDPPED